jgi:PleD family two-component response regulator
MRLALVDPSRTTRLIVTRMLEARGHEVVPFSDEREALAHIAADPCIEALITSAELKHISGVELCWETRLLATYKRPIYVLMMSTQYDDRSLIEALDSGADDFIGKPPLAEELYARLRAAERIASMQRELIRLATPDPLTGLCNRRGFFERATEACARTAPPDGSLSAIILDIDNFNRSTIPTAMRPATRPSALAPAPLFCTGPWLGASAAMSSPCCSSSRRFRKRSRSPKICACGSPNSRSTPARTGSLSPGA